MSNRITTKQLENLVTRINEVLGLPTEPYTETDGQYRPNAGVYVLDWAYGGVKLSRMSTKEGCTGQSDISGLGTKREAWDFMHAFLKGIEAGKQLR